MTSQTCRIVVGCKGQLHSYQVTDQLVFVYHLYSYPNRLLVMCNYIRVICDITFPIHFLHLFLIGNESRRVCEIPNFSQRSVGRYELKKDEPLLDEGCSNLVDQRKLAKLQWLQDASEVNWDNLKNVRREAEDISGIKTPNVCYCRLMQEC
jgi:hypothetical protein